jgi:hypothetical protein
MAIPKFNLFHHGVEKVADHVMAAIKGDPGVFGVYCDSGGDVKVLAVPKSGRSTLPDSDLVARYTRAARIEHIEDDLIAQLRILNSRKQIKAG